MKHINHKDSKWRQQDSKQLRSNTKRTISFRLACQCHAASLSHNPLTSADYRKTSLTELFQIPTQIAGARRKQNPDQTGVFLLVSTLRVWVWPEGRGMYRPDRKRAGLSPHIQAQGPLGTKTDGATRRTPRPPCVSECVSLPFSLTHLHTSCFLIPPKKRNYAQNSSKNKRCCVGFYH